MLMISNVTIVFSNSSLKIPKWLKFFVLHETLCLEKVAFADSKYDNIFLQLQPKITQIRLFVVSKVFCFAKIFAFWQILECWFQIWQKLFSSSSLEIPKRGSLGRKFTVFLFSMKLWNLVRNFAFWQNQVCWFQIW